ncbi:tetratricopeptide repeat protein [Tengunoibacter tsumagoiensis]|uniref:Tetratricopeptide repeat protein n=2 Tax=Tengunoibacter tsumagoiensis TaxID=2014871 RepID=A0A401ZU59_9CHLR|nr:tetratricopeptide repeat protein [Tengunoibacter tsumagoiensis]
MDIVSGIRKVVENLSSQSSHLTRPSIWNIPYQHNPFFTGRDEVLVNIHTQLQADLATPFLQLPYAISGLGGIGKTQIATEYAYRYYQDYEAVLWAHAEDRDTLISSYVAIATLLKLPECTTEKQEIIIEAVKRWLQIQQKWLLILDNVDDLGILPPFLPPTYRGHVLLTTRTLAMQRFATRLEIKELSDEQGARMILRRAGILAPSQELSHANVEDHRFATLLTQELGGLPLALDQAGAYVEATGMSLQEYFEIYKQYRQKLLSDRRSLIFDHPDSISSTWLLTFIKVQERNAAAADLLRLFSYFAPDAIAEEILTADSSVLGSLLAPLGSDAFQRNQAIEVLRTYSLIRRNPVEKTLSIHRLVQAVLQDNFEKSERHVWAERAMLAINAAFPQAIHGKWHKCERLLIQALKGSKIITEYQIIRREAGHLLFKVASYMLGHARYREAEPLYHQSMQIWEHVLGSEHLDMAYPLNGLAELYREQGKYREAEPLYQRAIQIREQSLGPEHPDVAFILTNLANLYTLQGKYREAELLYQKTLRIREQFPGPEHIDLATSLNGLAILYTNLGKYDEAELSYRQVLLIWEQWLGPEHPNLASSLNGLAELYRKQGKYVQAEQLYQQALQIREQSLGPEHPDVAFPLNGLANLYSEQGNYEKAEPLYQRALQIWEQSLGFEHSDVALLLNNLANLYIGQGNYEKAEPLYQRAIRINEQHLGPEHPDIALPLNGLANLYIDQGKYDEADLLYQRAIRINEQHLGPEHPDIALPLNNLGNLYFQQNRDEEAEQLYRRALLIIEQSLGPDHHLAAYPLIGLANLYADQSKDSESEQLYQRALRIREQSLGSEHALTQQVQKNYALLLRTMNQDRA